MSRVRTKLVVLGAATVVTVLALRALHGTRAPEANGAGAGGNADAKSETADEPALIDGRFWVETKPEKPTDYVHGAFFISDANFGLFERGSAYDIRVEFIDLDRTGQNLKMRFPQTGKDAKATFTVKDCSDKPPFDLCLDLSDNPWGGPKRYYGLRKQEDERKAVGDFVTRTRALVTARAPTR